MATEQKAANITKVSGRLISNSTKRKYQALKCSLSVNLNTLKPLPMKMEHLPWKYPMNLLRRKIFYTLTLIR